MSEPDRFRDAAMVRVEAPLARVRELLSDPSVLATVDHRLTGEELEVSREGDRVEVWSDEDHLHLAFRLSSEGDATKLAAVENVQPQGLVEQTKWRLFPGRAHEELEDDLDRFRALAESLASETTP